MAYVSKIPDSAYGNTLSELIETYNALINKGRSLNAMREGKGSKKEAECYQQAIEVCNEIIELCKSQNSMKEKWINFRENANQRLIELIHELNPAQNFDPRPAQSVQPQNGEPSYLEQTNKPVSPSRDGVETKTKSGFVTKNACKDVSANEIEKWYKETPGHDFSDVVGMDKMKNELMDVADDLDWAKTNAAIGKKPFFCCMFYGPMGTGKTFIIEGFVAELVKKGYTYIQLQSADILASHVGVSEKIVQIAFKEAIEHAPSVIYIDEFDGVAVKRSDSKTEGHERRLTISLIEEYNKLKETKKPIILLAATNHPEKIDEAWIDRMQKRIILPLPSEEAREKYFDSKFKNYPLIDGLTIDYAVDKTDNYSYRDLDSLVNDITDKIKSESKKKHSIFSEDGQLDLERSDEAVSRAIESGEEPLSLDMFEQSCKKQSPSPKEGVLKTLREYERKVNNIG